MPPKVAIVSMEATVKLGLVAYQALPGVEDATEQRQGGGFAGGLEISEKVSLTHGVTWGDRGRVRQVSEESKFGYPLNGDL